jgi:hypothetical protein
LFKQGEKMKPIKEIRLNNMLKCASKYRFDKDFCEVIGIRPTYMTALKSKEKGIGDNLARQIEDRLKLTPGWMDKDHTEVIADPISNGAAMAALIDQLPESIAESMKRMIFSIHLELGKNVRDFSEGIPKK